MKKYLQNISQRRFASGFSSLRLFALDLHQMPETRIGCGRCRTIKSATCTLGSKHKDSAGIIQHEDFDGSINLLSRRKYTSNGLNFILLRWLTPLGVHLLLRHCPCLQISKRAPSVRLSVGLQFGGNAFEPSERG